MIDVDAVRDLHEVTVARWHEQEIDNPYEGFLRLVCFEHQQNFRLWHRENAALDPHAGLVDPAAAKRAFDKLNQQRNEWIERMDDALTAELSAVGVKPRPDARQNTETPGNAIDRLSILALRLYHAAEQTCRRDAGEAYVVRAKAALEILHEQHADLLVSLGELIDDLFAGRKRLKVYHAFRMENEPEMNVPLYADKRPAA